jgi:protease IV
MQTNRSPLWALAGAVVGFMMPVVGMGLLAAVCLLSLIVMGGMALAPSGNAVYVSGPGSGPTVAILDVKGTIVSGSAGAFNVDSVAAADDILPLIRLAAKDTDVKAIVLRVDSPGGSVVPTDEIYHALKECGKPIVVSMGELAASGGYYISMAGQWLIANANTLTGSIGVISEFPEASQLLDNLGVTIAVIKSGKVKDLGSMYRPMTPEEQALWQSIVDETYEGFVQVVAEGRNMPVDKVRQLADGRVFTGRRALELGLIDALGYEEDAIAKATELGGITATPRVIRLVPSSRSVVSSLLSGSSWQSFLGANSLSDLLAPRLEYRWTG